MNEENSSYPLKQPELSEVLEEIKSLDTSKYKSHPMVEKLLVFQVEELKKETEEIKQRYGILIEENSKLKIEVAVNKEQKASAALFEWIRNIAGIGMGVSGGLIFSNDSLLSKTGMISTPILAIVFFLSCVRSLWKR